MNKIKNKQTNKEFDYLVQNLSWILSLPLQLGQQTFRRNQNLRGERQDINVAHARKPLKKSMAKRHIKSFYLGVLLNKFGEVIEEAVLWPEKVKLVVPLLFLHQLSEKLTAIASNKLGSELHNIQIKR